MEIRKVTVAGAGVLGAQIATQIACKGFDVCVYEVEAGLERAKDLLSQFRDVYAEQFAIKREDPMSFPRGIFPKIDITPEEIDELEAQFNAGIAALHVTTSPEEAFADPDIVIEAVPENVDIKTEFYKLVAPLLPEKTILLSNSSTLLPSTFAPFTGRPERFCAFHFLNAIWTENTVEIMGHEAGEDFPATDPETVEIAVGFAESIGMEPCVLKKEHARYIYNTMLGSLQSAALGLLVEGVADVETIDRVWKQHGMPTVGPFEGIDMIGINTVHNCYCNSPRAWDPEYRAYRIREMLEKMMEEGRLGRNAGRGFYDYS